MFLLQEAIAAGPLLIAGALIAILFLVLVIFVIVRLTKKQGNKKLRRRTIAN